MSVVSDNVRGKRLTVNKESSKFPKFNNIKKRARMNKSERRYLTVKELSSKINLKEDWIRSKVFRRLIPHYKIQGLIRFDELEINDWIKSYKKEVNNEI